MLCPRFSPGQVPMEQPFFPEGCSCPSAQQRAQLPLHVVPPRRAGKADHFPAPAVIKSDGGADALALGTESRALARGKEAQSSCSSRWWLGSLGNAGSIEHRTLNRAAEGRGASCRGGFAGPAPAAKGSSEHPPENLLDLYQQKRVFLSNP